MTRHGYEAADPDSGTLSSHRNRGGTDAEARRERLRQLFSGEELAWLISRLRTKMERGETLSGNITLRAASREQRIAIDRLLGRPTSRGESLSVSLQSLEDILRGADLCRDLAHAMETLIGRVTDIRTLGSQREAAWQCVYSDMEACLRDRPDLQVWRVEIEREGLLKRQCKGDPEQGRVLATGALAVVRQLPSAGIPIPELAAATTGDSHALDDRTPLGRLCLRAASKLAGLPRPTNAEERRDAWAAVGVLCDEFSAPVLVLNLSGNAAGSLTDRTLALHSERGEPARLTLRQLLREPPSFENSAGHGFVFVCENPAVVAAAASRLGDRSASLVCIEGQPTAAAHRLLTSLCEAGARLRYHGDFDWGGIRIANGICERYSADPWRMGTADYLASAPGGGKLEGRRVEASWDRGLADAMSTHGKAVYEEQVVGALLEDLA